MQHLKLIITQAQQNIFFLLMVAGISLVIYCVSYGAQVLIDNKSNTIRCTTLGATISTRRMAAIGMFSAISVILMYFEFPLPFLAPGFYKLDFSEIPVLICGFAFGPAAGVIVELLKVILHILLKGTSTAFVGDFANFAVGCSFIVPATIVYYWKKTKNHAILGCVLGTLTITVFGTIFNALYLLPQFSKLFGLPLDQIIAQGSAIFNGVTNLTTFVIFCVAPLNLLKGLLVSIAVMIIYKPISRILHQKM
ncbi:Riboflavin transporter RibU [Clostridiales bacterium CHKCI001]|nr:Riboflavin transporter RibU [Clostridiales bacterium CHKCI001]